MSAVVLWREDRGALVAATVRSGEGFAPVMVWVLEVNVAPLSLGSIWPRWLCRQRSAIWVRTHSAIFSEETLAGSLPGGHVLSSVPAQRTRLWRYAHEARQDSDWDTPISLACRRPSRSTRQGRSSKSTQPRWRGKGRGSAVRRYRPKGHSAARPPAHAYQSQSAPFPAASHFAGSNPTKPELDDSQCPRRGSACTWLSAAICAEHAAVYGFEIGAPALRACASAACSRLSAPKPVKSAAALR